MIDKSYSSVGRGSSHNVKRFGLPQNKNNNTNKKNTIHFKNFYSKVLTLNQPILFLQCIISWTWRDFGVLTSHKLFSPSLWRESSADFAGMHVRELEHRVTRPLIHWQQMTYRSLICTSGIEDKPEGAVWRIKWRAWVPIIVPIINILYTTAALLFFIFLWGSNSFQKARHWNFQKAPTCLIHYFQHPVAPGQVHTIEFYGILCFTTSDTLYCPNEVIKSLSGSEGAQQHNNVCLKGSERGREDQERRTALTSKDYILWHRKKLSFSCVPSLPLSSLALFFQSNLQLFYEM